MPTWTLALLCNLYKRKLKTHLSWDMNHIYYGGVNCENYPFLGLTNSIQIEVQCGNEAGSSSLRTVFNVVLAILLSHRGPLGSRP